MSVGRRRIRGTSIICLQSLVFKLVIVVTNTVPQVDKATRVFQMRITIFACASFLTKIYKYDGGRRSL